MFICQVRRYPSPWGALQESHLHEVRLVYFFNRILLLRGAGGKGLDAHRAAAEFMNNNFKHFAVGWLKAHVVYLKHAQGFFYRVWGNHTRTAAPRPAPHAAWQGRGRGAGGG